MPSFFRLIAASWHFRREIGSLTCWWDAKVLIACFFFFAISREAWLLIMETFSGSHAVCLRERSILGSQFPFKFLFSTLKQKLLWRWLKNALISVWSQTGDVSWLQTLGLVSPPSSQIKKRMYRIQNMLLTQAECPNPSELTGALFPSPAEQVWTLAQN